MRVVVEPHADDAYLSLHNHIREWVSSGERVIIVTVCSGTRKRICDAQGYASVVGARCIGLGLDEGFNESLNLKEKLPVMFAPEEVYWYIPLGLQNPDHKMVRKLADEELSRFEDFVSYYAEIPYYTKKKNNEEFLDAVAGMSMNSIIGLPGRKADPRYWKCFRDQSKFFYFNKPENFVVLPEFTFIHS